MRRPKVARVVLAIGKVTFLEILKDKVLYNILLCAAVLLSLGVLASGLTYIHPERVILDFGLSALGISSCMIAIFTGSSLISKEFERRTAHVALCHPISRGQFVIGKFLGLMGIIAVNWVLLSAVYLGILAFELDSLSACFSPILGVALILLLLESLFISGWVILFSALSTPSLTVIFSIGLYLVGTNISQIQFLAKNAHSSFGKAFLNAMAVILPNFEHFHFGTQVAYRLPVPWPFVGLSFLYATFMIIFCLFLAGQLIQSREV